MRKLIIGLGLAAAIFLASFSGSAKASVNINVNFISGYYGIPAPTVLVYENRLSSWEDVATLFFLSRLTGQDPHVILVWRLGGLPWLAIATRLNVPEDVFYIPYGDEDDYFEDHGPPYGRAWGYWNRSPHGRVLVLDDDAIRNRVVVLGMSRYYNLPINTEVNLLSNHQITFDQILARHHQEGRGHSYRSAPGGMTGGRGWQHEKHDNRGGPEPGASRGHGQENGHGNGHGHGQENGHGNGHGHGQENGHGNGHGHDQENGHGNGHNENRD